jgi:predicted metal-binding protein
MTSKAGIVRCQQTEDMCPGKRAVARAKMMVDRGAEIIALASCISRGNPIGFPCPHWKRMTKSVRDALGKDIKVIEWTH